MIRFGPMTPLDLLRQRLAAPDHVRGLRWGSCRGQGPGLEEPSGRFSCRDPVDKILLRPARIEPVVALRYEQPSGREGAGLEAFGPEDVEDVVADRRQIDPVAQDLPT